MEKLVILNFASKFKRIFISFILMLLATMHDKKTQIKQVARKSFLTFSEIGIPMKFHPY
jgi:hypothetical protein